MWIILGREGFASFVLLVLSDQFCTPDDVTFQISRNINNNNYNNYNNNNNNNNNNMKRENWYKNAFNMSNNVCKDGFVS